MVRIGNNSVTRIEGNVAWSIASDARIKKNMTENVPGLKFLNRLRPVTYIVDTESKDKFENPTAKSKKVNSKFENVIQSGFIAQEVEAAAKALNYSFDGVNVPENQSKLYSLSYATFVVPLVKALQEQQSEIEKQQLEIQKLKA